MTKREEISIIENKLRTVFNRDKITTIDVNRCNKLLERWKELTKYVPAEEPKEPTPPKVYSIIDEEPNWTTKNQEQ